MISTILVFSEVSCLFHCQNYCNRESLSRKRIIKTEILYTGAVVPIGEKWARFIFVLVRIYTRSIFFRMKEEEGVTRTPNSWGGEASSVQGGGGLCYTPPVITSVPSILFSAVFLLHPSLFFFTSLFLDYTYNVIFQFAAFHRLYFFFNLLIQNATMNNLIDK